MVIVTEIKKEDEKVGLIIIPGATANADFMYGQIVAIGAKVQADIFTIGDKIIFPITSCSAQTIEGKVYQWVPEDHIWGIFE